MSRREYAVTNRIRVGRAEHRLTQEGLGKLVGASKNQIANIENGKNYPSILLALLIARCLQKTVDELFQIVE